MEFKKIPYKKFIEIYHQVPRLTVDVIVETEEGIILTKRSIPPFKGMWHIPGGSVLFRESIKHTIDRVADEELGIKVGVVGLAGVIEYPNDGTRHSVSIVYLTHIKSGTPKGSQQGKEIEFFKKIPDNCIPNQKIFLKNFLKKPSVLSQF